VKGLAASGAGAFALLAAAGCHAHTAPRDVPAVLTRPTSESREELARVVSDSLHGTPVTLADEALTTSDTLIVERTAHRDAQGRRIDGRASERPEHFRLVRDGTRCVLVHEATGRRSTLQSATCAPR
jgi:hypothetical protein